LLSNGAKGPQRGGLYDRQGRAHIVFDADGTREAYRQRAVANGPDRPGVRRRAAALAAAGYTGRKRGEVVRTRLTLQQAHTHEWLGTFGAAGNGERWPRLERAADAVVQYLRAHGLTPGDAIMRFDGEYGWARTVLLLLVQRGLGYLMRCVDYRLLDLPKVREALAQPPQRFEQTDTGTVREVYEVGWVPWVSEVDATTVTTRLVVTRLPARGDAPPKIGKRIGDWAYELFVTDRPHEALSPTDVLSLYFGRGGFEQTLNEEDQELEPDRWVSGNPDGQEAWQILSQWVWNMRLQLGLVVAPCEPRITLWSDALPTPVAPPTPPVDASAADATATSPCPSSSAPAPSVEHMLGVAPCSPPLDSAAADATATSPSAPSLGDNDPEADDATKPMEAKPLPHRERRGFVLQSDGTVLCPAHKLLHRAEVRGPRVRFRARDADCRSCSQAAQCLGPRASGLRGRRFDWPAAELDGTAPSAHSNATAPPSRAVCFEPAPQATVPPSLLLHFEPPPSPGPQPLYWYDLPATTLRRLLPTNLAQQRIDGLPAPRLPPTPRRILDRDRRAHRRLSWSDRLARNARAPTAPALHLHLHGISGSLADYLGVSEHL
jgi:hypothetical protein